jgi:hypothetical protein
MGMADAAARLADFGRETAKPGEQRYVALERIDVHHEEGDDRYRYLKAIAANLSVEWTSLGEVARIVERFMDPGPWAEVSTESSIREGIECGLLQDRRDARGEAEVRRNPDPPPPKTANELIEAQVERAAAEERRLVQKEVDARERVGREQAERIIAAEGQTTQEHMAPVIHELRAEFAELRELIENSQSAPATEERPECESQAGSMPVKDNAADPARRSK